MSICLTDIIDRYEILKITMLSLKDTDLGVTQLHSTNNSVVNLPLKISRVARVRSDKDRTGTITIVPVRTGTEILNKTVFFPTKHFGH